MRAFALVAKANVFVHGFRHRKVNERHADRLLDEPARLEVEEVDERQAHVVDVGDCG
jgi:hypothetical protein